jgi:tRNA-Thr(GGU) m(6)t(6)A37 methyltransferase TsaA
MANQLVIIGVVRTGRTDPEDTPVQASLNWGEEGTIVIDPQFGGGLEGLEEFDYLWLLTWLGEVGEEANRTAPLKQTPFLLRPSNRKLGIFATRGPRRVNPLGLSLVRLRAVSGNRIRFGGVDLIDGTAVVDLKPYVARFDRPPGVPACGWFDGLDIDEGVTPAGLARRPSAGR